MCVFVGLSNQEIWSLQVHLRMIKSYRTGLGCKTVSFTLNKTKHCVQFKPINPDHLFKGTVHPENKNIFTFACSALCPLLFSYCCLKIFCFSAKFSFLCYIDTVVVFVRCIRSDYCYSNAVIWTYS